MCSLYWPARRSSLPGRCSAASLAFILGLLVAPPALAGKGCRKALVEAWADEYGGEKRSDSDLQRQLARRLKALPCRLTLDIDGDGKKDSVSIVAGKKRTIGLEVRTAAGRRVLLGGGRKSRFTGTDGDPAEPIDDFALLHAWRVARFVKGKLQIMVHKRPRRFAAPGARGDGIWISGSDAAEIIYLSKKGRWRVVHLGY